MCVVDNVAVTGAGATTATIRLEQPGTYLVCGFSRRERGAERASALAVHAATVTVPDPVITSKTCGNIGGRRDIPA
jgi:hypothetical protein